MHNVWNAMGQVTSVRPDGLEDFDGDGVSNWRELSMGLDPSRPDSMVAGMADGDSIAADQALGDDSEFVEVCFNFGDATGTPAGGAGNQWLFQVGDVTLTSSGFGAVDHVCMLFRRGRCYTSPPAQGRGTQDSANRWRHANRTAAPSSFALRSTSDCICGSTSSRRRVRVGSRKRRRRVTDFLPSPACRPRYTPMKRTG